MTGCQTIDYNDVTPDVFNCMKKKLEARRFHIPPGNSGEIEGNGVKVNFNWDGKSYLKINTTEKPSIVRCGYVIERITDLLQKCQGKRH